MSAETFLQLAEQGGFLDAKTVNNLRKKLADSSTMITAHELAALLVRRNVLTSNESKSLLQATDAAAGGEARQEDNFDLRPARSEPESAAHTG